VKRVIEEFIMGMAYASEDYREFVHYTTVRLPVGMRLKDAPCYTDLPASRCSCGDYEFFYL